MKSSTWIYFSSHCRNELWILQLHKVDDATKSWERFQKKHDHEMVGYNTHDKLVQKGCKSLRFEKIKLTLTFIAQKRSFGLQTVTFV